MEFIPVKGFTNIFLNTVTGDMFTVKDGKDIPLKTDSIKEKAQIVIAGKHYEILYLVLGSLGIEFSIHDRITYKITKGGFISPNSIKIVPSTAPSDSEHHLIFQYKCDVKANSANSRFKDKISASTVLQVLKLSNYNCLYCGSELKPDDWQLDHFHPKAFAGKNVIENLAASCRKCNMMKGYLDGKNFLKRCFAICANNKMLNEKVSARFAQAKRMMEDEQ